MAFTVTRSQTNLRLMGHFRPTCLTALSTVVFKTHNMRTYLVEEWCSTPPVEFHRLVESVFTIFCFSTKCWDISLKTTKVKLIMVLEEELGVRVRPPTNIIRIQPLMTCTQFHGNPSNLAELFHVKVVGRPIRDSQSLIMMRLVWLFNSCCARLIFISVSFCSIAVFPRALFCSHHVPEHRPEGTRLSYCLP